MSSAYNELQRLDFRRTPYKLSLSLLLLVSLLPSPVSTNSFAPRHRPSNTPDHGAIAISSTAAPYDQRGPPPRISPIPEPPPQPAATAAVASPQRRLPTEFLSNKPGLFSQTRLIPVRDVAAFPRTDLRSYTQKIFLVPEAGGSCVSLAILAVDSPRRWTKLLISRSTSLVAFLRAEGWRNRLYGVMEFRVKRRPALKRDSVPGTRSFLAPSHRPRFRTASASCAGSSRALLLRRASLARPRRQDRAPRADMLIVHGKKRC